MLSERRRGKESHNVPARFAEPPPFGASLRRKTSPLMPMLSKSVCGRLSWRPQVRILQLYELYHVTWIPPPSNNSPLRACISRLPRPRSRWWVFVTRQDLYRRRAKAALEFERGNVERNSPAESRKTASRIGKCTTPRLCRFYTRAALVCWAHPARQWRTVRAYLFR